MRQLLYILLLTGLAPAITGAAPRQACSAGSMSPKVEVRGYVGDRIHTCISGRVKTQDVEELVEPFRHQTETWLWQSEFLGKWMLGAVASYEYTRDEELFRKIKDASESLMATQLPNGYIGNYAPEAHLTNWDIWGRKYTALALMAYHRISGERGALDACSRLIDHLISELGQTGTDIAATGSYFGMASCSVLEPVVMLYEATGEKRYLDFAKDIVRNIEKEGRSQLVTKALNNIPVSRRSPYPKTWWSYDNGQKAYEMMSCYEGLTELGRVLGNPSYLEATERTVASILADEINIAGSGAAFECWYEGKRFQTVPAYHTMETCVTFTWMQLCSRLLRHTRNTLYADEFERTMYNALMASMKCDGSQISKYSPLEGRRQEGEEQCGIHINCCNANGPRAFALIPATAYQNEGDKIYVNLYLDSDAEIKMGKNDVHLHTATCYPVDGKVEIGVDPRKSGEFTVALRIPLWADSCTVAVNGEPVKDITKGGYAMLHRKWNKGDKISADFNIKTKVEEFDRHQALVHGPLVMARDSRYGDGDVDECAVIRCDKDGVVAATLTENPAGSFAWIEMDVPAVLGTDLENPGNKNGKIVKFCDFGSAGNDWDPKGRYRVWIPRTLHMMSEPYHKY